MEDVESFRHEHESITEWRLRKMFLEAHHDKMDVDSLMCMASCFVNVEMYECKYPPGVMVKLRDLMEEIGDELDEERKKSKKRSGQLA